MSKLANNINNKLGSKIIGRFPLKKCLGCKFNFNKIQILLIFFLFSKIEYIDDKTVVFKFTNGSLNVTIKQGDLSKEICDAIVNPTNNSMKHTGGLDTIIHQHMGEFFTNQVQALSKELQTNACPVGNSRIFISRAERDPNVARFVINTVGPDYRKEGKDLAAFHLQSCYSTSLLLANTYGLTSIAYPAISCGAFHYPAHEAAQVGIETIRQNSYQVKDVRFILFDRLIYDAFVGQWTEYSEQINREVTITNERDRTRITEPFPSLSTKPSTRYCILCKQQQLLVDQQHLCNQCSGSTRSEIFNRFLQQLRSAAEISFDELKKECNTLKPILSYYPLTYTPVQTFDQSIHKRDTVAESYLQNYCNKEFRNAMPMAVLGDGNCFYNTFVKLGGAGTTTEATTVTPVELRARNILELILNVNEYRTRHQSLEMILDNFQKYVTEEMVRDTNYAAVWDLLSIPTVLNIKVTSVYPKVNGVTDTNYQKLNGTQFEPLANEDTANNNQITTLPEVKLLFSHCNKPLNLGGNVQQWVPNHFVPLLNLR